MELLNDSEWHSEDDIKLKTHLNREKLDNVLIFLEELELIERQNAKIKITNKGIKFLTL